MILLQVRNKLTSCHSMLTIPHKLYTNHNYRSFNWSHAMLRGQLSQLG
jgi:hypothetical protein